MVNGSFSLGSVAKKNNKYFISAKDNSDPFVTAAEDEEAAMKKWAKQTGRNPEEAVVSPIGFQRKIKNREIKPAKPAENIEIKTSNEKPEK